MLPNTVPAARQHTNVTVGQVRAEAAAAVSVCVSVHVRACVLHCHVVRTARWTAGVSVHLVPCCTISSSNIQEGARRAGEAISSVAMTARGKVEGATAPARNSWVMDWKAVDCEGVFDPPWRSAACSK